MFVLGIDPGLSRCGYGCVAEVDGKQVAVGAGVITTDRDLPLPSRLALLKNELTELDQRPVHPWCRRGRARALPDQCPYGDVGGSSEWPRAVLCG